jgi:hypothetical protein
MTTGFIAPADHKITGDGDSASFATQQQIDIDSLDPQSARLIVAIPDAFSARRERVREPCAAHRRGSDI